MVNLVVLLGFVWLCTSHFFSVDCRHLGNSLNFCLIVKKVLIALFGI